MRTMSTAPARKMEDTGRGRKREKGGRKIVDRLLETIFSYVQNALTTNQGADKEYSPENRIRCGNTNFGSFMRTKFLM